MTAVLFCLSSPFVTQSTARQQRRNLLPRVGAIGKLEEGTKNIGDGCGNHMLIPRNKSNTYEFIFISSADGLIAWMNLNGRNLRLESVKTTLRNSRDGNAFARHEYRLGRTLITVSFLLYTDYISEYPAKIILRKGRAVRTIKAVGLPQCD